MWTDIVQWGVAIPYILESNPRPFHSFRGLKSQMRIRIACGLDSRSWAGFWKNGRAAVRAVRTIQYNNLLLYLLFIILYNILYSVSQEDCARLRESVPYVNPLTPNDDYSGRTAPLTSKRCILYIYSTHTGTTYFKRGIYSPFFPLQNAVCFINLTYLVPVLFTF